METIITSAITAAVTLVVCLINNYFQSSKQNALLGYRLDQLERKMDKHNQIVERLYKVEDATNRQGDELARVNARIKVLEGERT